MKKKCIVLLSGGQDSATCLFWAKQNFEEVYAVSFDYGQKHKLELGYARRLAEKAQVLKHKIVPLQGVFSNSALVDHEKDITSAHSVNKELPASFTAGRNILFLTIASSWAHEIECHDLATGVCQTDYSGYPDCRRDFIDSMEVSLSLGLDSRINIHTPLMYLTKAETWKLASELGVVDIIVNDTLTDYNGNETLNYWGRGAVDNPASELRKKGYDEAVKLGYLN